MYIRETQEGGGMLRLGSFLLNEVTFLGYEVIKSQTERLMFRPLK